MTNILDSKVKLVCDNISVFYGDKQVVFSVNVNINANEITSFIGASGCGKSTFLRVLNRMNDFILNCSIKGNVYLDGEDIYDKNIDPVQLRTIVGMVFQKPNPFPKTIFDNIAYGPRIHGLFDNKSHLHDIVCESLDKAGLFEEVKDRLNELATSLSGGQQQRLCIARCIALKPQVILMDEPCSSLDPIATAKIEDLILDLKERYTIIIVTHSMQQAARVSQKTAFFHLGKLVEFGDTKKIFTNPSKEMTQDYITGRFG